MKEKIEVFNRDILYQYYSVKADKKSLKVQLLYSFIKLICTKNEYIGIPQDITYYVSLPRKDYHYFMDSVMKKIDKKCKLKRRVHLKINFSNIIIMLSRMDVFLKTKSFALPKTGKTEIIIKPCFIERIIIFLNLIIGIGIYKSYCKLDFSKVKKLVVLCDVWQEESMLVQYANDKGIPSITCQHALFIPGIDNTTYDILNMWEVKATKALLWGNFTKEQYRFFNPYLQCEICGNPTVKEKKYSEDANTIGIAMDLPRMHEYNQKMIDIIEEYAKNNFKKVLIRIHPSDEQKNYRIDRKISRFENDLDSTKFIVAHTTTMIFTYLLSGKKVLKLKSDIPFFPIDDGIMFDTLDNLIECVKYLQEVDYKIMAKEVIQFWGETAVLKYKESLE